MSYCLNPYCRAPENGQPQSSVEESCSTCGVLLLLDSRYGALQPIGQGALAERF